MPASIETSSRRRPFTRRFAPPYAGRPACSGVMRARRVVRNSRMSLLASTTRRYGSPAVLGRPCWYPSQPGLPAGRARWFADHMTSPATTKTVWLITGAGRGMGVDIARAALAAGHAVVATGRDAAKVADA